MNDLNGKIENIILPKGSKTEKILVHLCALTFSFVFFFICFLRDKNFQVHAVVQFYLQKKYFLFGKKALNHVTTVKELLKS